MIEVMVALAILAIGLAALAGVMAANLRYSGSAEHIKLATSVTEAELDYRQQKNINDTGTLACESPAPDGFTCTVEVTPCQLVSGEYDCTSGVDSSATVAYRISVSSTSPRGYTADSSIYLSKALQAVGTDNQDDGSGQATP